MSAEAPTPKDSAEKLMVKVAERLASEDVQECELFEPKPGNRFLEGVHFDRIKVRFGGSKLAGKGWPEEDNYYGGYEVVLKRKRMFRAAFGIAPSRGIGSGMSSEWYTYEVSVPQEYVFSIYEILDLEGIEELKRKSSPFDPSRAQAINTSENHFARLSRAAVSNSPFVDVSVVLGDSNFQQLEQLYWSMHAKIKARKEQEEKQLRDAEAAYKRTEEEKTKESLTKAMEFLENS